MITGSSGIACVRDLTLPDCTAGSSVSIDTGALLSDTPSSSGIWSFSGFSQGDLLLPDRKRKWLEIGERPRSQLQTISCAHSRGSIDKFFRRWRSD